MTLTAVPGLSVGHATDAESATGCTVVVGPFRAAADVRGLATGTRQFDALSPLHVAPEVDAIVFTGGSAYGLAAADGVASWLEERDRGFDTGVGRVAIVPTAVIFDLGDGSSERRPDAGMGREACERASRDPVAEGRVGAGAGATVGKLGGGGRSMPGGVGSFAATFDGYSVGALVVVNAFGDVLDARGEIIAGGRDESGRFIDTARRLREHGAPPGFTRRGADTTLAVVATDCPLTRTDLHKVARQSMNALVRHIAPANSQFDGDIVIACSTGAQAAELAPVEVLRVGLWGEWVTSRAIERAVGTREPGDRG